jgi:hypothetical protein
MHLAREQQRIERGAEIVDDQVAQNGRGAGLRIDLDLGQMGAVGIGRRLREERVFLGQRAALRLSPAGRPDLEVARGRFEGVGGPSSGLFYSAGAGGASGAGRRRLVFSAIQRQTT